MGILSKKIKSEETLMSSPHEDNLIDLLRQIKKVLDESGVKFWIDCGTLLWGVRNGKFSPVARDIDLGGWLKDENTCKTSVSKKLSDKGFKVWVYENHHMNVKKEGEEFWADLNFYHPIGDKAIYPNLYPSNLIGRFLYYFFYIFSAQFHQEVVRTKPFLKRLIRRIFISTARMTPPFLRRKMTQAALVLCQEIGSIDVSWVVPVDYFRSLKKIKFYGMEVGIPVKTEEYLTYRYGKDWKIPKNIKTWQTWRDDGAVLANPNYKLKIKNNPYFKPRSQKRI